MTVWQLKGSQNNIFNVLKARLDSGLRQIAEKPFLCELCRVIYPCLLIGHCWAFLSRAANGRVPGVFESKTSLQVLLLLLVLKIRQCVSVCETGVQQLGPR